MHAAAGAVQALSQAAVAVLTERGSGRSARCRTVHLGELAWGHVHLMALSISAASSSGVGSGPRSRSISRRARASLLMASAMCAGSRMVRD